MKRIFRALFPSHWTTWKDVMFFIAESTVPMGNGDELQGFDLYLLQERINTKNGKRKTNRVWYVSGFDRSQLVAIAEAANKKVKVVNG